MEGRFIVFYHLNDGYNWSCFDTEEEVRDFLDICKTNGNEIIEAVKILDYITLDITD